MDGHFFVTGATGTVGSHVIEYLRASGMQVIGAGRPSRATERKAGLDYRNFDFTDSSTWETCLDGVTHVFLMRPPQLSNIRRDMEPFLRYLKVRAVDHVTFMSVQGVENNKKIPHHVIEQACIRLNLPFTFIRPSFFMQNLTTTHLREIRDERILFTPAGSGRTNFIDARDVGEIAARVLMDDSYIGRAITVTGEVSYSYSQVAELLSEGLGENVRYVNPGPVNFLGKSLRYGRGLMKSVVMLYLYSLVKAGKGDISSDDSERILGRKTRSLCTFIDEYKNLLLGKADK